MKNPHDYLEIELSLFIKKSKNNNHLLHLYCYYAHSLN